MKRYTVNERTTEIKLFRYDEEEARNLTGVELKNKVDAELDSRGDYTPNATKTFDTPDKALEYFNSRKDHAASYTFSGNCGMYGSVDEVWIDIEEFNEKFDEWEEGSGIGESEEVRSAYYIAPITFNK